MVVCHPLFTDEEHAALVVCTIRVEKTSYGLNKTLQMCTVKTKVDLVKNPSPSKTDLSPDSSRIPDSSTTSPPIHVMLPFDVCRTWTVSVEYCRWFCTSVISTLLRKSRVNTETPSVSSPTPTSHASVSCSDGQISNLVFFGGSDLRSNNTSSDFTTYWNLHYFEHLISVKNTIISKYHQQQY